MSSLITYIHIRVCMCVCVCLYSFNSWSLYLNVYLVCVIYRGVCVCVCVKRTCTGVRKFRFFAATTWVPALGYIYYIYVCVCVYRLNGTFFNVRASPGAKGVASDEKKRTEGKTDSKWNMQKCEIAIGQRNSYVYNKLILWCFIFYTFLPFKPYFTFCTRLLFSRYCSHDLSQKRTETTNGNTASPVAAE